MTVNNKLQNHVLILNLVCAEFGITPKDLFIKSRKKEVIIPRQIFYYLAKKYTRYSLQSLGLIGFNYSGVRQDHATVLHAKNTVINLLGSDDLITIPCSRIESKISEILGINPSIIVLKEEIKNKIDKSKDVKSLIKLLKYQYKKLKENELND